MPDHIFVFDNFYTDPYAIRQFALEQDFTLTSPTSWKYNTEEVLWPGKATEIYQKNIDIDSKVSKLLGKPVRSNNQTGFFRLSKGSDTTEYVTHVDGLPELSGKKIYAGIVYLSLPKYGDRKSGTVFHRHKVTGKIKLDSHSDNSILLVDSKNKEAWEIYHTVESKFNRIVLMDHTLFHALGDVFGDTKENGRLAQIFTFFEI
jgi:hypothetical protein